MKLPTKCRLCGGEVAEKTIEKVIKGGNNTAVLQVAAGVCLKCGEHLYAPETVEVFEEIRRRLELNRDEGFREIGKTYAVQAS